MNTYEAMIVLDNREVKKAWEPLKSTVDSLLTKHGAEIIVAKRWDERRLAYEIRKQRRATFYLSYFKADPEKISDIFRDLNLSTSVLRSLILRVEEVPEEAFEPERDFSLDGVDEGSSDRSGGSGDSVPKAGDAEVPALPDAPAGDSVGEDPATEDPGAGAEVEVTDPPPAEAAVQEETPEKEAPEKGESE